MTGPTRTFRLTTRLCPACGGTLDAASSVGHRIGPKEGDVTVCFYCTAPLMFALDGYLLLSDVEVAALEPEVRAVVQRLQRELQAFRGRRSPPVEREH